MTTITEALQERRDEVVAGSDFETSVQEIAQESGFRLELQTRKFNEWYGSAEAVRKKAANRKANALPPIDYVAAEKALRAACFRYGIRNPERFLPLTGKTTVILGHRSRAGTFFNILFDSRTTEVEIRTISTFEEIGQALGFKQPR